MKKILQDIFTHILFILTLVTFISIRIFNEKYDKTYIEFLDKLINIFQKHE